MKKTYKWGEIYMIKEKLLLKGEIYVLKTRLVIMILAASTTKILEILKK